MVYNKFKFICHRCGETFEIEANGPDILKYQAGLMDINDFEYLEKFERYMISANICFQCLNKIHAGTTPAYY